MADVRDAGRQVAGEVAHDLPVVSKPIIIGAFASSSAPANVSANGDAVYLWALQNGALCVNIASGGGTQYNEGDLPSPITGTVFLWNNSSVMQSVSTTNPLPVQGSLVSAGAAAHGNVVSGNPVLVGLEAKNFDGSALPNTVTEGDVARVAGTLAGIVYVMPVNADGSNFAEVIASQGGTWNIGTVTPGTGATNLGKAEDAAHTSGDVGIMALAVANENNNTRSTEGNYTPLATDTEGNLKIIGNRNHDTLDDGEPVGIGGRAIAHGTNPTAVAAADRTVFYANRAGIQFVMGGHPNVKTHSVRVLDSDGAQTNVAMVTVATGLKIVVTRVSIKADGSNTGPINCTVGFGTATLTTPNTTTAGTGILADFLGVPPGGGCVEGNGSGILGVGADDEDIRYTVEDPVGGAITISVSYFTIES